MRFTVTATGGADLTYKWQWNGADLDPLPEGVSGDTTRTLQINNVKKSHQGDYTCIVSNAAGPTTSERAQLTIRKCFYLLFIVYAAMKSSVCVCVLCVCVGVYVWVCVHTQKCVGVCTEVCRHWLNEYKNSLLVFLPPFILHAVDPPQITHGPAPQKDVVPGSTVRFTVTATGGGELTYKWQQNGTDLDPLPEVMSGETTRTLQIDNVKKSHQGDYTCIVSNTAGPTASERAQLTVRKCFYLVFIIQQ